MAEHDDGHGSPTIKTGDIQTAEFTVNKYVLKDGEVVTEEVESDLDSDDIASFSNEVEAEMDSALDEMDQTGSPPEEFDLTDPEPDTEVLDLDDPTDDDSSDSDSGTGSESLDNIAEAVEDEGGDFDSPLVAGRTIAQEEEITRYDFPTFAKNMRDRGDYDQDTISEVWSDLRDEGALVEPDEEDKPGGGSSDSDGEDVEPPEPDEGDDGGTEAMFPEGQDVLLIREGSAASEKAAEALAQPMLDQDVLAIPVGSDFGEELVEPLSDGVEIPAHLVANADDTFSAGSLEDLFGKYI